MTQSKIAVAIISLGTGDDPQNLQRCLQSITPYTDGVFVTLTGPKDQLQEAEAVCKKFNAHISYQRPLWTATQEAIQWLTDYLGYAPFMQIGDEIFLFDVARNYNFSQIPKEYEWIFWIDTDDVLMQGKNLWKLKTIGDQAKDLDAFFIRYVYRSVFDEKGNIKEILLEHLRERMVRNTGRWKWVAPLHESLIAEPSPVSTKVDDCFVLHKTTDEHILHSVQRNLKNLELALYQTKGEDPRHVYYLAKGYIDLKTPEYNERAITLIKDFLWGPFQSEWPEERAQAYEYLSDLYRQKGELNNAIKACFLAFEEEPQRSSLYQSVALAYVDKKEWDKALFWIKLADKVTDKPTTLNINPRDSKVLKLSTLYTASVGKGETDDAYSAIQELKKILPNEESVHTCYEYMKQKKKREELAAHITAIMQELAIPKNLLRL